MPDEYGTTNLSFLQFQSSTTIRMYIDAQGRPWWVAAEICALLEVRNVSQAIERLDEDEKNTICLNDGLRGNPTTLIVNESGLYMLIFSSRKPVAKVFKRWITHEVLPSLRQTGSYTLPGHEPQYPSLDIPQWQQRPHIALMQLKASGKYPYSK